VADKMAYWSIACTTNTRRLTFVVIEKSVTKMETQHACILILIVMPQEIDAKALAEAIVRRREGKKLTVRAAAAEMESVSSSTLSRIERGNLPDLDTYMRICRWLNVDPAYFASEPTGKKADRRDSVLQKEDIITHLRADKGVAQGFSLNA
jgi:transcriptional regulator with XRE-family HTH domain